MIYHLGHRYLTTSVVFQEFIIAISLQSLCLPTTNENTHTSHQVSQHQDKKKTKCIVFLRLPVLLQSNISSFPFCLLLFSCSPSWSHCYEEEIESYMGADERIKRYLEQGEKGVIYP